MYLPSTWDCGPSEMGIELKKGEIKGHPRATVRGRGVEGVVCRRVEDARHARRHACADSYSYIRRLTKDCQMSESGFVLVRSGSLRSILPTPGHLYYMGITPKVVAHV